MKTARKIISMEEYRQRLFEEEPLNEQPSFQMSKADAVGYGVCLLALFYLAAQLIRWWCTP